MTDLMKELDGFVVFEPLGGYAGGTCFLTVTEKFARPSLTALRQMGDPKYIVVFFDERRKRVMLMAAEKKMANTFRVLWGSDGKENGVCSKQLCEKILRLAGAEPKPGMKSLRFPGHKVEGADGKVIFELGVRSEELGVK